MPDMTSLEVSPELCQYIEVLVEKVVLKGEPFESNNKFLPRFCGSENIDYNQLETNLKDLFETAEELKTQESKGSEHLFRLLGKECYLSKGGIDNVLSAVSEIRAKSYAKRKKEDERCQLAKKNRIPVKILLIFLVVISVFEIFSLKWWCIVPLLSNFCIGFFAQEDCASGMIEFKKFAFKGLAIASICFLLSFLHWWSLLLIPIATVLLLVYDED